MSVAAKYCFSTPIDVVEQPLDPWVAVAERAGHPRGVQRVDLTGGKHLRQRLARRDAADVQIRLDGALLDSARGLLPPGVVRHRIDWHAVVFGEDAPDPHACGQLEFGGADALAAQVGGCRDAGMGVDVDPAVAEHARGVHRQRDERLRVPVQCRDVGRQRHLRDVELTVPQHPEERLLDRQSQIGQVDAIGANATVLESTGPVIVATGKGQVQTGHGITYPRRSTAGRVVGTPAGRWTRPLHAGPLRRARAGRCRRACRPIRCRFAGRRRARHQASPRRTGRC